MAEAQACKRRHAKCLEAWAQNCHVITSTLFCWPREVMWGLVQVQGHAPAKPYGRDHGYKKNRRTGSSKALQHKRCDQISALGLSQWCGGWIRGDKAGSEIQAWAKRMPRHPTIHSSLSSPHWDLARSGKGGAYPLFDPRSSVWALGSWQLWIRAFEISR